MMSFTFSQTAAGAEAVDWRGLTARVHQRFVAEADVAAVSRLPRAALAAPVRLLAAEVLSEGGITLAGRERDALVEAVVSEIAGLGPLDALLLDPEVTEIMVNGAAQIYVERAGKLSQTSLAFDDDAHVRRIMERIVAPLGRRIDEASPLVDARLADGSRRPKDRRRRVRS